VNFIPVTAALTLTNGVALGTYGVSGSYGLGLGSAAISSEGTPTQLNWVARYNTAQEQSVTNWSAHIAGAGISFLSAASSACTAKFTGWSVLGGAGKHFTTELSANSPLIRITDCRISGGEFNVFPGAFAATICLWERVF